MAHQPDLEQLRSVVPLLYKRSRSDTYPQLFRALEEEGIHLTPVQYYQPLPDTRTPTTAFGKRGRIRSASTGILTSRRQCSRD